MTRARASLGIVALALGGCATRADLIAQERRVAAQLSEQRKAIQVMQREMERLRGDVEGTGPRAAAQNDQVAVLEERLAKLEGKGHPADGEPPAADGTTPPPAAPAPAIAAATPPPTPPPQPSEDVWARDVARDQQAIAASTAPERPDLEAAMDSVARKDCGRAVSQLNSFAAQKKESPLASQALYWAARCYALKGDRNQAISKFYDAVTKYPKGSKAPAALWEQGNLFIEIGDTPDARLALGKLIKDYPSSDEAARARKRLTELDR